MLLTALALNIALTNSSGRLTTAAQEARLLSTELHVAVDISPPLKAEILYVDPHGLPPKTELSAVADALNASAIRAKSGLLIERTAQDLHSIHERLSAERAQWIDRQLAAVRKYRGDLESRGSLQGELVQEIQSQWKAWDDFQRHGAPAPTFTHPVREILPCEVLLESIIERLGSATLAAVPSGTTQVFETDPTPDANSLPQIDDLVQAYSGSLNRYASMSLAPETLRQIRGWIDMQPLLKSSGPAKPPRTIRLKATASPAGLDISLEVFDAEGAKLDSADLLVTMTGDMPSPSKIMAEAAASSDGDSVPLSSAAISAANFRIPPPGQRLPEWVMEPDRDEPLGLFVEGALAALADRDANSCVAADVPDTLWGIASECVSAGKLSVPAFERMAAFYARYQRVADGRGVCWRSDDPESVERDRSNRAVLAQFAQRAASTGRLDVRNEGRLYYAGGDAPWSWPMAWQSYGVNSHTRWHTDGNLTNRFYCLIGAISDNDWSELESGKTLTAGQLGAAPELQALFDEDAVVVAGPGKVPDLLRHPSEAFKNTDLSNVPISLRKSTVQALRPWLANGPEPNAWIVGLSLDYVYHSYASSDGKTTQLLETREQFDARVAKESWIKFGQISEQTLYIGQPQGYYVQGDIPSDDVESSVRLSYADLPQAVRDRIWRIASAEATAGAEKIAHMRGNDTAGGPTNIIPPR